MNSRGARVDTGAGVSFIASAVIHLTVFLLLLWWGRMFPPQMTIQETYYVDVVNLPVADPHQGEAVQQSESAPASAPVVPPPMSVPHFPKVNTKTNLKAKAPREDTAVSESAFTERIAKLERNTEAKREEAALERLRTKVKSSASSKNGAPGASGAEAGSRYADFIKSRLEDALKITSSYTTKNPEVAVRLTIALDGKLARLKIERSSGDATFELAVRRAIDLASEKFTAPPNNTSFESGFVFKPKSISSGTMR